MHGMHGRLEWSLAWAQSLPILAHSMGIVTASLQALHGFGEADSDLRNLP